MNPFLAGVGRVSPRTPSLLYFYFSYDTLISTCIVVIFVPVSSPLRAKLVMDSLSGFALVLYIQLYFSIYIGYIYKQVLLSESTGNRFLIYLSAADTYRSSAYNTVRRP